MFGLPDEENDTYYWILLAQDLGFCAQISGLLLLDLLILVTYFRFSVRMD